jgi:hypothetical protein
MNQKPILLKPSEILFRENDQADGLFIIKKGIVRLFRPKGKGYIEVATLHAGELVGEMALFEEGKNRRSCSAEAVVSTELVEIKFDSFHKACDTLNPWFKTIINTLISRLNISNKKIKSFEENSVVLNYDEKESKGVYEFFKNNEIVRLFCILYLAFKTQNIKNDEIVKLNLSVLEYYTEEIFGFSEIKIHEFVELLNEIGIIEVEKDDLGEPKVIICKDIDLYKSSFIFFNNESREDEEDQCDLTDGCLHLLNGVLKKHQTVPYSVDHPTVNIQSIIEELKVLGFDISGPDFIAAVKNKLIDDPYLDHEGNAVCTVHLPKLIHMLPILAIKSKVKIFNANKRIK